MKIKLYLNATKPIRALLRIRRRESAARPHRPNPGSRRAVDNRYSATADYAPILDHGNLKDAEVLKELVRKSVVPALRHVTPKSLASA